MFRLLLKPAMLVKLGLLALTIGMSGCKEHFWTNWWTPGDTVENVGYHPPQPIDFNHNLHVEKNKIECNYCHNLARRSPAAGIPPMNTCMGCHTYVATDKDPIKYLTAKYNKNEAIEWVKVHDMPDFVRFSHQAHVTNGKVACEECHGDVAKMGTAKQVKSLQMGWCIECHTKNNASKACYVCHY